MTTNVHRIKPLALLVISKGTSVDDYLLPTEKLLFVQPAFATLLKEAHEKKVMVKVTELDIGYVK